MPNAYIRVRADYTRTRRMHIHALTHTLAPHTRTHVREHARADASYKHTHTRTRIRTNTRTRLRYYYNSYVRPYSIAYKTVRSGGIPTDDRDRDDGEERDPPRHPGTVTVTPKLGVPAGRKSWRDSGGGAV